MRKTIVGMFGDPADARRAVLALEHSGTPTSDISVVLPDTPASVFESSGSLLSIAVSNQATTTAMDHGAVRPGAALPGEPVDSPAYGAVVAAGPIAAAIGGAALGVSGGGLTGSLSNMGIPNETARDLINRVRSGLQTLVSVRVRPEDRQRVEATFVECGAVEVYVNSSHARTSADGEASIADAQIGF